MKRWSGPRAKVYQPAEFNELSSEQAESIVRMGNISAVEKLYASRTNNAVVQAV
jgi:hypothetical protein